MSSPDLHRHRISHLLVNATGAAIIWALGMATGVLLAPPITGREPFSVLLLRS
jgi:hypothetical protein